VDCSLVAAKNTLLIYSKGVFGSKVFSQFWKNTVVFSNTAVLYTEWCLAS
jgi:hypothetical protein